jgi:hypothetical protein
MSNGYCSNLCYHRLNSSDDDAPLIYAKSATRFFTFCELAARGGICHRIIRVGKPFITISGSGERDRQSKTTKSINDL